MNVITGRQRDQLGAGFSAPSPTPSAPANNPPIREMPYMSYADGAPRMPMTCMGYAVDSINGQQVLQTNPQRGYLYIQNNSNDPLFVAFDRDAQVGVSLIIGPGGFYEPRIVPTNAIYVKSKSLSQAPVIVIEGTLRQQGPGTL